MIAAPRRLAAAAAIVFLLASPGLRAEPEPEAAATATATTSTGARPAPIPIQAAPPERAEAAVRLKDRRVFSIRVGRGGLTAAERARRATKALEQAAAAGSVEVRIEETAGVAAVIAGATPIVQLAADDAEASGDATLSIHAASIASSVASALREEHQRAAISTWVFSLSLLVFSALIAWLVILKLGEVAAGARRWIEQHPEQLPALRIRELEVLRPAAVGGSLSRAIALGRSIARFVVAYVWLIFAFSLFPVTSGYGERLTSFVLRPISEVAARLAAGLPLIVVALVLLLALAIVLRFVGLFASSVARGETSIGWLAPDLAEPLGVVVRFALIVLALIFGAPLVSGAGASRAAIAAYAALGLAAAPLLASGMLGALVVFGRRIRAGDHIAVGGRSGRVSSVGLLEVRLEDDRGAEVRIPHLLALLRPIRIAASDTRAAVEIVVAGGAAPARVEELLLEAARSTGAGEVEVELVALAVDRTRWRIRARSEDRRIQTRILVAAAERLRAEGIALGAHA